MSAISPCFTHLDQHEPNDPSIRLFPLIQFRVTGNNSTVHISFCCNKLKPATISSLCLPPFRATYYSQSKLLSDQKEYTVFNHNTT